MAEHRVPMLGGALRRRTDPSKSSDPRVRELVAALATLEVAPAPRADFRAELRAQLVAVTPRLVDEGNAEAQADTKPSAKPAPGRRRVSVKKPLFALVGAMAAFIVLIGGAVLLSRNALPGDALYGVKRASENTEYSLTGGNVDKGNLKLEFAARRIGEVADLLPRATSMAAGTGSLADSGAINSETSKLIRNTLGSANTDVQTAARMLGSAAVHSKSVSPLNAMTAWTPAQITKMTNIAARIPADGSGLHSRAATTLALLKRAQQRASTLKTELNCSCLGSSGTDELGPIPCATGCASTPPGIRNPTQPTKPGSTPTTAPGSIVPTRGRVATTSGGGSSAKTTAPAPPAPATSPTTGGATTKPVVPITTKPPDRLPTLPLPTLPGGQTSATPILPIGVDSCGVHATLAGLGIGIGGC
jgi:Domain of unknown function (DUF5667)